MADAIDERQVDALLYIDGPLIPPALIRRQPSKPGERDAMVQRIAHQPFDQKRIVGKQGPVITGNGGEGGRLPPNDARIAEKKEIAGMFPGRVRGPVLQALHPLLRTSAPAGGDTCDIPVAGGIAYLLQPLYNDGSQKMKIAFDIFPFFCR